MKKRGSYRKSFLILVSVIIVLFAVSVGVFAISPSSITRGHVGEEVFVNFDALEMNVQELSNLVFEMTKGNPPVVIPPAPATNVVKVVMSKGNYEPSICILLSSGEVKCSGKNNYGQLGVGDFSNRNYFSTVSGLSGATDLVNLGRLSYCAIVAGGKVQCWGYNKQGQLGTGDFENSDLPSYVIKGNLNGDALGDLGGVTKIVGRESVNEWDDFACALTDELTGNLYCWGYNGHGQLGIGLTNGVTPTMNKAVQVPFFVNNNLEVRDIVIGGHSSGGYACAIAGPVNSAKAYCWGYNGKGQLGDGTTASKNTPVEVIIGASPVHTIEASQSDRGTVCASAGPGKDLYCWGYNRYGQVGDNSVTEHHSPTSVPVTGVKKIKSFGNGDFVNFCAVTEAGSLYCWGYDGWGRTGTGAGANDMVKTPTQVLNGLNVIDIDGYGYGSAGHACALTTEVNNNVWCWGYNKRGQVGVGQTGYSSFFKLPQAITTGLKADKVEVGGWSTSAQSSVILSDKSVRVWGSNEWGQLGLGSSVFVSYAPQEPQVFN